MMELPRVEVGVIGGSGLYEIDGIADLREVRLSTPFGEPSDAYVIGRVGRCPVAFLPRHGRGHRILPSEVNSRANLFGFKLLGAQRIISVSAVGSMREEIHPRDMVVPDQLIDRTRGRPSTFFGGGLVVHVGLADPFCPALCRDLLATARAVGARVHAGGTYICIEGPQFSTRAESAAYRAWGASVIGMTALPEARLAREAELCYATLALATDYDVWHTAEAPVTVEMVMANLASNVATARAILERLLPTLTPPSDCACPTALANAIVTPPALVPDAIKRDLAPILGRYLPAS